MNPVSRYIAVAIQTDYGDASDWETVEKNMKNCGRLIDWAMLSYSSLEFPIKLVAFPEYFIQGIPYTTKNALLHHRIPVKIPGDVTDYFQKIAQKYDIYIAAGSLLEYDETWDEAIGLVNDSEYGLQAGVYTTSIHRAFDAVERLEVGGVIINDIPTFRVDNMPYGGVKNSGIGKEGVKYSTEEMTELKFVSFVL